MYKFLLIIFQLLIITILSLIVVNNSFVISIEINDFIYSVQSPYIFLFFLIFFLLIFLAQNFYLKIKFSILKLKFNNTIKKKEKGYGSFVNGMIALANKDYKKAILESNNISKYLNDNPSLSLLLRSEIYKVEKKYDQLKEVFDQMSKNKSTENLAYRGIMEQYLRAQDYHHAFIYGEKLFNNNPFVEKIYETLVNIVTKTSNWQQLINISEKSYAKKIIEKKIYEENKSIALFEISKIKQLSQPNESIKYILQALKLRKNFPPYVKLYLELLIANKDYNLAKKYLKKVWSVAPHPEYKLQIDELSSNLKIRNSDFASLITSNNLNAEESKILMVEAAIQDNNWERARNQIKELLNFQPKKEVCLLMARIEEGDTGDIQKINAWTLRSNNGDESNIWVCLYSNYIQETWSSISDGGYFNSLEWKKPSDIKNLNLTLK